MEGKWLRQCFQFPVSAAVLGVVCFLAASAAAADGYTVYHNAKIYTADREKPEAAALVVKDGKFIYVGDDQGALAYGSGLDLQGKRVVPGMIDSHCHPVLTAAMVPLQAIHIEPHWNLTETLAYLKETAADAQHKELSFIFAIGFGTDCRPNRAVDLDRAVPDRPAILFSSDGHAYWLNTRAMELAKLSRDTPDPIPGASFYERDAGGNPTGYVVETTAGFDMLRKMGLFTPELIRQGLHEIQRIFQQNGITAVFEAGFCAVDEAVALQALREMEQKDELTMRYFTSYVYFGTALDNPDHMLETMLANREKYTSDLLRADTLKMIGDGTLEVQSAWMAEDYLPPAKGRGAPTLTMAEMLPAARAATAAGFNVHNHAIGDATISMVLDLFQQLGPIRGTKTICHVQVLPENGVQRFAEQKQDVFYQTTPCWLLADQFTEQVLGRERYLRQVPLASLVKAGVTITFGSDFPVSGGEIGVNPFFNLWTAVNRATNLEIAPPKSEAITVKDCIDAYTINGARQLGAADRIGSITVGKSADFVVCSDDFFTIDPEKLKEVTVEQTYFRGKLVYKMRTGIK